MIRTVSRRLVATLLAAPALLAASVVSPLGAPGAAAPARAAGAVVLNQPKSLGGWGVVGLDLRTSPLADFKGNVTALAELNGRIYVGGMFTAVAKKGVVQAQQPYLAAFDRATGAWVPGFRPVLDGGVWDLVATPAGQLLVAGYFSSAGGVANRGLALLDPTTGAAVPGFSTTVAGGATTPHVGVRTIDVNGDWVYLGGHLTSVTGGVGAAALTVRGKNLFRVRLSDGRPDGTWKPLLSTAPWQVDASAAGDRVYAAGMFGTVNATPKRLLAVLSATNGALLPGLPDVQPSIERPQDSPATYRPYAQVVQETQDRTRLVFGPTEHTVQMYDRAALARVRAHGFGGTPGLGNGGGGDVQAVAQSGGVLYVSCHCWKYIHTDSWTTSNPAFGPWSGETSLSKVSGIVAFDAATLVPVTSFLPAAYGNGDSAWQLFVDSTGCLWAGGDYTHAAGGMWLGGFAKFCTA